jgi:hypothetical protein
MQARQPQLNSIPRFSGRNNISFAETQLRDFLFSCGSFRPGSVLIFQAQGLLAQVLGRQGMLDVHGAEAERLALESAQWALGDPRYLVEPPRPNLGSHPPAASWLQEHRGAILLAEKTLQHNCERRTTCLGSEHSATQTVVTEYAAFLVRYSRRVGAANVGP